MFKIFNSARLGILLLLVLCTMALQSCANIDPLIYQYERPALDIRQYFNGPIDAWGVFTDRSGEVKKRFTVKMRCSWKTIDNIETGTLDEDFTYSDGTTQKRIWTLRKVSPNRYVGTAADVVGEAIGIESGNTLHWQYTLALPVDGSIYNVQFSDWMFLMDDNVMLNRASMSKLGIHLGDVTLSFTKR